MKREQNQIINLTTRVPEYRELAGCVVANPGYVTRRARYTLTIPTLTPRKRITKATTIATTIDDYHTTESIEDGTTEVYSSSTWASLLEDDFTDVYGTEFDSESIFDDSISINETDVRGYSYYLNSWYKRVRFLVRGNYNHFGKEN